MAAASLRRPNFYCSIGFGIVPDNSPTTFTHALASFQDGRILIRSTCVVRHFAYCPGSRWIDRGMGVPAQLSGCWKGPSATFRSLPWVMRECGRGMPPPPLKRYRGAWRRGLAMRFREKKRSEKNGAKPLPRAAESFSVQTAKFTGPLSLEQPLAATKPETEALSQSA